MSTILKIFVFPAALIIMTLGIDTILGGHITPGGGFQGGAIIAGGFIFCIIVYGIKDTPIKFSEEFIVNLESAGALAYVFLGLAGLIFSGYYLYNLGVDLYSIIPPIVKNVFDYPDPLHAGIIPYLNFVVGMEVFGSLSAVALIFLAFKKEQTISGEDEEI